MTDHCDIYGERDSHGRGPLELGERLSDGRLRFRVRGDGYLPTLAVNLSRRGVAIEVCDRECLAVIPGDQVPQLEAQALIVQPDLVALDWRQGWIPIGGSWDDEVYLSSNAQLDLPSLDGDAVIRVSALGEVELEQTGTFQFAVIVDRASQNCTNE